VTTSGHEQKPIPQVLVVHLAGRVKRDTAEGLSRRIALAAATGTSALRVVCDVQGETEPDLSLIDTLARLQLAARRHDASLAIRHACPEVRSLLQLVGLLEVFEISDDTK
jgi:anti-anti-sigma regulatory factor